MLKQPYIGKHIFLFHTIVFHLLRNNNDEGGEAIKSMKTCDMMVGGSLK